jgi:hypothetical protein
LLAVGFGAFAIEPFTIGLVDIEPPGVELLLATGGAPLLSQWQQPLVGGGQQGQGP